jgi:hypothetical protein
MKSSPESLELDPQEVVFFTEFLTSGVIQSKAMITMIAYKGIIGRQGFLQLTKRK